MTCLIFHGWKTNSLTLTKKLLSQIWKFCSIVDRAVSTEIETALFSSLPAIPLLFPAGADLQGMPEQILRKRWQITGSGLEHHHAIFLCTVLPIEWLQLFTHRGIRYLGPREPYGNIFFVIVYLYFHAAHLPFSVSMVVLTDKYSIFKDRLQFTITCIPPFQSHCSISCFFLCFGLLSIVVQSCTGGRLSNRPVKSPNRSAMPVVMEMTVFRLIFCRAR